jgi:hypothetical protein
LSRSLKSAAAQRQNRSTVKIARVAKVNGDHKLGQDLRATNEEIRHEVWVIGGSGLIGKMFVNNPRQHGYEVVAASPSSGVNPSLARDWLKRLQALRSSSTWRTHLCSEIWRQATQLQNARTAPILRDQELSSVSPFRPYLTETV